MSRSTRGTITMLLLAVAVMVSGCAGFVEHRRYTWRSCAPSFLADVQACVGAAMYTSGGQGGPPGGGGQDEECMKGRQDTAGGGKTTPVREGPSRGVGGGGGCRWAGAGHPPRSAGVAG